MNIQTEQNSDSDVKNKLDIIVAKNVDVFYGSKQALENITIDIPENQVTSLIGPSGCGKSTAAFAATSANASVCHWCSVFVAFVFATPDIKGVSVGLIE